VGEIIFIIIIVLCILVLLVSLFMVWRNEKVYKLRTEMLHFQLNEVPVTSLNLRDSCSYYSDVSMFWRFWIPISKFRKDYYKDYEELGVIKNESIDPR
jgi:hypothetical protein